MEDGHGKLAFGHGATPKPESTNDVTHCQKFIGHPGLTIFLLRLIHVTLILIHYACAKRGVVMALNRGRRRWVINCSCPEAQPIAVLEVALGESLLWKCFTSIFMIFLTGFAHYTRQSSM